MTRAAASARIGAVVVGRRWPRPTVSALVVAVLLPLATFLMAVWLLGWQLQVVLSGSMAPTYPVGSLLVVGQIDASEVEPGMAVAFIDPLSPDRIVTHRVIGPAPGETLQFRTQGDANAMPDAAPVPARLIRGRVLWSIPGLGDVLPWLQWPRGFLVLVLVPGALLLLSELQVRRRGAVAPA